MHEPINKKHAMVSRRRMDCHVRLGLVNVGADLINITLSWPPSVNRIWRCVGGRVLLSAEGRAYRELVAAELWQKITPHFQNMLLSSSLVNPILTGRLSMTIHAYPPDKRKRDIDNLAKASIDAIGSTKLIFDDDSQIDHLSINRCAVEKPGRLEIQIWEHEQTDLHNSPQTCDD